MGMRLAAVLCLATLTGCGVLGNQDQGERAQVSGEVAFTLTTTSEPSTTFLASPDTAVEVIPATTTATTTPLTTGTSTAPTTSAPTTSTTAAPTFADSFAAVSSGVVRVEAILCDGSVSTGSGFLIEGGKILTAAHVIGDAPVVRVTRDDGTESRASVIGSDSGRDLALLTLESPFGGHSFEISDSAVRVGDEVAALGHPRGLPLTFTSGRVSNLNFSDQGVLFHQTDAPINEGNSGGPLIDQWGRAIGMADWKFTDVDGIAFVVAAPEIHGFLESDAASIVDLELGCPEEAPPLNVPEEFADVAASFVSYIDLVNTAREEEAWEQLLSPAHKERRTKEDFSLQMSTTFIDEFVVNSISRIDDTTVLASVGFVSLQAPELGPDEQTCSVWSLLYQMVLTDRWRIDSETNNEGSPAPCEAPG